MQKKTIVIGASDNPLRYSYKAVHALLKHGHDAIPIGIKNAKVAGISIQKGFPMIDDIHTVTLYIGKNRQDVYYNYILDLKPKRVIFNPGTENDELKILCEQNDIETVENCTLVMLAGSNF